MAPRRRLLLLLAVAAACSVLAACSPVHAETSAAEPTAVPTSAAVDDDLLRGIQPYLRPIDVRGGGALQPGLPYLRPGAATADPGVTSYDVTVVFRATRRVGPPRLNYAVLPVADDEEGEEVGALPMLGIAFAFFAFFCLCLYGMSRLPGANYYGDESPTGAAVKKY